MADMRALLRRDSGGGFAFEEALALSGRHDRDLITRMIAGLVTEGFLVEMEPDRWECSDKGRALKWTSRQRVTREKAEQRLAEVIARASIINADDNLAMVITAIVVFGAFLRTDQAMIGDVDVAVVLQPRFGRTREQDQAEDRARQRAPRLRNIVEQVCWPSTEVLRALRARSSAIEVHEIHDLTAILASRPETPYRVVFGDWTPPDDRR
jgi:hypothetical protein